VIHSIKPEDHVHAVSLLANGQRVEWQQQPDGLHLTLPAQPVGDYAYVYRIELAKP